MNKGNKNNHQGLLQAAICPKLEKSRKTDRFLYTYNITKIES